jgi:hypothetical protein
MEKYGHTHLNIRQMHLLSPQYVYQKGHTHGKNNTQLQNVLTLFLIYPYCIWPFIHWDNYISTSFPYIACICFLFYF